ncbi:MAG TPA: hypothetical protein VE669_09335 [Actinomycetota bacterium]|jgi:hypothetical protein|nr:hypothetical protein [Actinomycetota bacterium]
MSQAKGFDISKMSTASKILLGGGVLYLIDLFLPWQRVCVDAGPLGDICASASGIDGIGIINLLLAIALIAWEAMAIAGVDIKAPRALVSAGLAAGIVVFTILKIIVDSESLFLFAWLGIVLALVIAYGGWMRWQEHQAGGGTMGGSMGGSMGTGEGGGFTS